MSTNENKESISIYDLDSLIKTLKERALLVNVSALSNPEKFVYTKEKIKRTNEVIEILTPESSLLFMEVWVQYFFAAFSDNKTQIEFIIEKLELSANENWFIDLNDILRELSLINESEKFQIDSYKSLAYIVDYVGIKILAVLYNKYVGKRNNEPLELDRVRNYLKTKNKAKKEGRNPVQNKASHNAEWAMAEARKIANGRYENNDDFWILKSLLTGDCEAVFLKKIYKEYLKVTTNPVNIGAAKNKDDKYLILFDLFKLIIKDKYFADKVTFDESEIKYSYNTYNNYKKKIIKNIIALK